MKFADIQVGERFKPHSAVAGKVVEPCPIYQRIRPIKYANKHDCNCLYYNKNGRACFTFMKDNDDVDRAD